MDPIDPDVLARYEAGIERNRLRHGLGLIECARTKELLSEFLPDPPAVVYDIGGGYGEYAWHLASRGHRVHLFDLSHTNITMSNDLAPENVGVRLQAAEVADARSIARPDASANAILLMGPLYHLVNHNDRMSALQECHRLLKPGGVLFAGAITRYATTLWALSTFGTANHLLDEPAFVDMLLRELTDGHHIRPKESAYHGMGRSFFHHPDELRGELTAAGFPRPDVRAIIGGGWLVSDLDEVWKRPDRRETIMRLVRKMETEECLMGLSTHLMAISTKP